MLGDALPNDVSFQLNVCALILTQSKSLTVEVLAVLGPGEPCQCRHVLSSCVPASSVHLAVCYASLGKSFGRCDILLRSSNCANIALRCLGLCGEIYCGDSKIFPAVCTPNHLEHESKCL
jgi:hypothetical protein